MKLLLAFLIAGAASASALPPLQLSGSTTVQAALEPKHAELEERVGRKIEFEPTGTNVGLASLAAGDADVAMISAPLEEVAQKLNAKKPGTIEVARYRSAQIGRAKIAFLVNPRNPVRSLTAAQLEGVLTAKIKNWKELGGNDGAIIVVSIANGGPLIPDQLLHGAPITPTARFMANATQIPAVVAQEAHALGIISSAHMKGPTSLVRTEVEIALPLFLVTKGEPTTDQQKLIDAARKILGGAD